MLTLSMSTYQPHADEIKFCATTYESKNDSNKDHIDGDNNVQMLMNPRMTATKIILMAMIISKCL